MVSQLVFLVGALAVPLTCAPLRAQTNGGPGLEDVVSVALLQNPDIVSARLRVDSAHGEQRIARAIPNPLLASNPNQPWNYSATILLDVMPQRILRTRAAGRGTEAARADADDVIRQVTFAVRQAFYDVLLTEQQRDLVRERRDIFRQLLAADSVRLRAGDVPPREVTKAELELARADADLMRADAQVHAARLALQLLMGVADPDTAFTVRGELAYRPVRAPFDSLAAIAGNRSDVRSARARVGQSRALRSLSRSMWIPVPEVSLTHATGPFGSDGLFSNGTPNAIGFGFVLPVFDWNGGERERSAAGLEQAELNARRVQALVANDVATAVDAYRSSRGLAENYEGGLLAKARAVLETARYAYGTGAVSLLELLDAIATYSDTRSDYYTAVHDYWVSVFALSRAAGKDLLQ